MHWCADPYDAASGADVLVIITEWNEFRALDLDRLGEAMQSRVIVDLRNVYRAEDVQAAGFQYSSIGRTTTGRPERRSREPSNLRYRD